MRRQAGPARSRLLAADPRAPHSPQPKERRVQVLVRDNNVDQALKALKKKMQREGIFREMKLRGHYEKPSEEGSRESGSDPPSPQARPQAHAARGPADEAEARDHRRGRRAAAPAPSSRRLIGRPGLGPEFPKAHMR